MIIFTPWHIVADGQAVANVALVKTAPTTCLVVEFVSKLSCAISRPHRPTFFIIKKTTNNGKKQPAQLNQVDASKKQCL